MSEKKITTKFSKLGNFFNANNSPEYSIDFSPQKYTDRAAYEKDKLEYQQAKYLNKLFGSIHKAVEQRTLIYESTRLQSYYEYDLMAYYPIVGTALDILTEEACMPNEKGDILNIYSSSPEIKNELSRLFNDNLNIHTNLPVWTYLLLIHMICLQHKCIV
jgi:hypothetical protein